MFSIVKKAKMSREAAKKAGFTDAEIKSWDGLKIPGTTGGKVWYGWDFTTHVIGCGDEVPNDFDPNDMKHRFKIADDYTADDLVKDVKMLLELDYSVKTLADAINGGLDLSDRAKAPPTPKKKMSDNDKVAWVIKMTGQKGGPTRADQQKLRSIEDHVKLYDKLNG